MASQMQPQKYYSSTTTQLALEALTICPKKDQSEKHCDSCIFASSLDNNNSSSSSLINGDDYIGTESCIDLDDHHHHHHHLVVDVDDDDESGVCSQSRGKREQQRYNNNINNRKTTKREFPPPIPSIARAENQLFPPHMPYVLKRYYTADGRLILKEEKVKNQEYLRAHRSNGRLTLHLVPIDDEDDEDDVDPIEEEEEEEEITIDEEEEEAKEEETQIDTNIDNPSAAAAAVDDDDDEEEEDEVDSTVSEDDNRPVIDDSMVKLQLSISMAEIIPPHHLNDSLSMVKQLSSMAPETPPPPLDNGVIAAATANGLKCLDYTSVRSSTSPTCFLGLPVPAIRPVHS